MSYTIRMVLTPEETDQKISDILYLLDRVTFPADAAIDIEDRWWWIIRDKGGRACGFAGLEDREDESAFLCRVGVLKQHRGHNLQARTIKLRETLAKKQGFKHLVTYTSAANFSSANSLIKCGFTLFKPADAEAGFLCFYKCLDEKLSRKEIRSWQGQTKMFTDEE